MRGPPFLLLIGLFGLSPCGPSSLPAADEYELAVQALLSAEGLQEAHLRQGRELRLLSDDASLPPSVRRVLELGPAMLPALLAACADPRPLPMPPITGRQKLLYSDLVDRPDGPDLLQGREGSSVTYQPRLGDLCATLVGQFTNRRYGLLRQKPSGRLIIAAPTNSPLLLDDIIARWDGIGVQELGASLGTDLLDADSLARARGAYRRLARWFPTELTTALVPLLRRPTYDAEIIAQVVDTQLLVHHDPGPMRQALEQIQADNDILYREAIRQQLFARLADPRRRDAARAALRYCFDYPETVGPADRPRSEVWEIRELARLIVDLLHEDNRVVTATVAELLRGSDNDYLALACFHRLLQAGRLSDIDRYLERRLPLAGRYKPHLQAVRSLLDEAVDSGRRPTVEQLPPFR